MPSNAKMIRTQLSLVRPLLESCSLKTMRKGQNIIGELMGDLHKEDVIRKIHDFGHFEGAWILPKDQRRQGVILYLHGGGFTCGDLEYAAGVGATLASELGCRVFCPAYRLAPETPFPGGLEDVLTAYQYLLDKGYTSIILCGESAGGGLCYSLCLLLQERGLPMPQAVLAISPWVDLTLAGESHSYNQQLDVSLTEKQLAFFAEAYCKNREDPRVSPIFGDLTGMPPSFIVAAKEELLYSDAQMLCRELQKCRVDTKLMVKSDRWHAFPLYGLQEDSDCFTAMNRFLNKHVSRAQKLRWMRLDNAAKIYPAARNENWSNIFRLSATLTENVDMPAMERALDITLRRFPSIAVRLRRGVFWYYLEQLQQAPPISQEFSYPLTRMSKEEVRRCALRVIVHENRIAVEMFHSITDGNGALVFLKSLVAEYLQQRYGVHVPAGLGVLGRLEEPKEEELEDSFPKCAGPVSASRAETDAWRISGTPTLAGFQHLTCFTLSASQALELAHKQGVSLTCYLTAALLMALQNMQAEKVPYVRSRKLLKVQLPVNLRNIFPSSSLRNFALYTITEIDPRLGKYTFSEICQVVKNKMGTDITPKQMSKMIATNVSSEKIMAVRIMPLFLKNLVMKAVFKSVGERKQCLSLSNLGNVQLPQEMLPYVERLDFILGVQASAPHNCGVISYKDKLYINFIRDIKESDLEYHFFRVLRDMGLDIQVQSNSREE